MTATNLFDAPTGPVAVEQTEAVVSSSVERGPAVAQRPPGPPALGMYFRAQSDAITRLGARLGEPSVVQVYKDNPRLLLNYAAQLARYYDDLGDVARLTSRFAGIVGIAASVAQDVIAEALAQLRSGEEYPRLTSH